jgi:hypothetical protein
VRQINVVALLIMSRRIFSRVAMFSQDDRTRQHTYLQNGWIQMQRMVVEARLLEVEGRDMLACVTMDSDAPELDKMAVEVAGKVVVSGVCRHHDEVLPELHPNRLRGEQLTE